MSEFQFAWPWVWFLLMLPLVSMALPPAQAGISGAVKVPFFGQVGVSGVSSRLRRILIFLVAVAIWVLLTGAAARPQWVGEPEAFPVSGRDLLLAVDLSGSMDTRDMIIQNQPVNRLRVVKQVAGEFIERRRGDRVGLILFGSRAYLQTPLTFDITTTATLLDESEIGLAGRETAIGDAIGLAVKRLREDTTAQRVLIVLTDGANTSGEMEPLQAAQFAARENMTIYTIGVGADEMMIQDVFGSRVVNPSADLDEDTLRAIAQQTGGRYFRARDTAELEEIYIQLDKLEPVESDQEVVRPVTEWFYWPLTAAFILAATLVLIQFLPRLWSRWRTV